MIVNEHAGFASRDDFITDCFPRVDIGRKSSARPKWHDGGVENRLDSAFSMLIVNGA